MSGRQILEKEQHKGIHDVVNDQDHCIIGWFQTQSAIWKFPMWDNIVRESVQQSKRMDWLSSFLMLIALEVKIFLSIWFSRKMCVNNQFPMWENQFSKAKGWMNSFLTLSVLEARIFFQYGFLEEHKVCVNNHYWSSMKRNEVAIMATKPEFLAAKKEMLVAL